MKGFERFAVYDYTPDSALLLGMHLEDTVAEWLDTQPESVTNDYALLKQALLDEFDTKRQALIRCQEVDQRKMLSGESVHQYATALQ
jgi:hypothetical protein